MEKISAAEWLRLIKAVFPRLPQDEQLAFLIDVPNRPQDDCEAWRLRRELAFEWCRLLQPHEKSLGLTVSLFAYASVDSNNADLPDSAARLTDRLPSLSRELDDLEPFSEIYRNTQLFIAPTQFSATAPLKNAARQYRFRAATMPGFSPQMIPALRIDYERVNTRCRLLKEMLDAADGARVLFQTDIDTFTMFFDLRHRSAHVSSGRFPDAGTAGNLPSGETYIVPYEGEAEESRTAGLLPVQIENELLIYEVRQNRAVAVRGAGPAAERERERLRREPAYGNMAELGFGVLADFGLTPIGEILLDEKLGFHVAFGRSDHFGGAVGPTAFSSPQAVIHLDRIYVPQLQEQIRIAAVDITSENRTERIMEHDRYLIF